MTGLDLLKAEMKKRGCTPSQVESRIVPVVLDIIANATDGGYTQVYDLEKEAKVLQTMIESEKKELKTLRYQAEIERHDALMAREAAWGEAPQYIQEFEKSLEQCETAGGRDALRRAQFFINTVSEQSKYDHTEIIRGLWAILSGSDASLTESLASMGLKKFPDKIERGTIRRPEGWSL